MKPQLELNPKLTEERGGGARGSPTICRFYKRFAFSLPSTIFKKTLNLQYLLRICLKSIVLVQNVEIKSTNLQFLRNKTVDSTAKIKPNLQHTVMWPLPLRRSPFETVTESETKKVKF